MQIIKHLRRKKGIRQKDLAIEIGVSLRTIQLYEKKGANIPIKNLTKIAAYFETTVGELYLQEINEEREPYLKKEVFTHKGTVIRHLPNGKVLVSAHLVLLANQKAFLEKFREDAVVSEFIRIEFLLDFAKESHYMAFEISGNAMDDGTSNAIPGGALVLCRRVMENELKASPQKFLNTAFIVVAKDRILCKWITDFFEDTQALLCHNLNPSPEFKDFEMPLSEVLGLFQVVRRQL